MVLLRRKRPWALVILAHGCAFSKYAPYQWFVHDWAAEIVKAVVEFLLDEGWKSVLRWPLGEFGLLEET